MTNENYYAVNLNSQKLLQVYDTAIPRIKRYLNEEINFVKKQLTGKESVLEIACGYGRILKELSPFAAHFTGIDISKDSIQFGQEFLLGCKNVELKTMDAFELPFSEKFDIVLCLQNGISAVKGNPETLISKAIQALRKHGKAFFSTYSPHFWEHRLQWFKEQADKKLLGEIDEEKTKDGVIICKDGFKALTFSEKDLIDFGEKSGFNYEIKEVDGSSLFLILTK
ncbi:class I SAM-dependent methyltransferase [Treponema pedis]|uniref:class I SAM-dependent methyltransferase n=1 Tax=Treponema pedis TaxID=409322 RepID=UPI00040ABA20|nr:class I SAM-dependent methyltransferase [Treponema pedis]